MKHLKRFKDLNESMYSENCERCGKPTNGVKLPPVTVISYPLSTKSLTKSIYQSLLNIFTIFYRTNII